MMTSVQKINVVRLVTEAELKLVRAAKIAGVSRETLLEASIRSLGQRVETQDPLLAELERLRESSDEE